MAASGAGTMTAAIREIIMKGGNKPVKINSLYNRIRTIDSFKDVTNSQIKRKIIKGMALREEVGFVTGNIPSRLFHFLYIFADYSRADGGDRLQGPCASCVRYATQGFRCNAQKNCWAWYSTAGSGLHGHSTIGYFVNLLEGSHVQGQADFFSSAEEPLILASPSATGLVTSSLGFRPLLSAMVRGCEPSLRYPATSYLAEKRMTQSASVSRSDADSSSTVRLRHWSGSTCSAARVEVLAHRTLCLDIPASLQGRSRHHCEGHGKSRVCGTRTTTF